MFRLCLVVQTLQIIRDDYEYVIPDVDREGKLDKPEGNNQGFPFVNGVEVKLGDGSKHNIKQMEKNVQQKSANNGFFLPKSKEIVYPILNWRKEGNYEEVNLPQQTGPGEYGAKVTSLSSEKEAVDASIKEFGFNMVNSDKISLDRLPKDLRHQE